MTPRKDLPHYVQSVELEDRKSARKVQEAGKSLDGNQEEEGRSSSQMSQKPGIPRKLALGLSKN